LAQPRIPAVAEGCGTQCPLTGRLPGIRAAALGMWIVAVRMGYERQRGRGWALRPPPDEKVSLRNGSCSHRMRHGQVGIDTTDGTANSRRSSEVRNIIAGQAMFGRYL
jgi:hypothetical protein